MSSAMTTQRATLIGLWLRFAGGWAFHLCAALPKALDWPRDRRFCTPPLRYASFSSSAFRICGPSTGDTSFLVCRQPTRARFASRSLSFFCWRNADDGGGHGELPLARSDTPFAVVFNGVRSRWWIAPGMVLAFCGIVEILAGGQGFSLEGFISRLLEHPLSYILAVGAAVTWAAFPA